METTYKEFYQAYHLAMQKYSILKTVYVIILSFIAIGYYFIVKNDFKDNGLPQSVSLFVYTIVSVCVILIGSKILAWISKSVFIRNTTDLELIKVNKDVVAELHKVFHGNHISTRLNKYVFLNNVTTQNVYDNEMYDKASVQILNNHEFNITYLTTTKNYKSIRPLEFTDVDKYHVYFERLKIYSEDADLKLDYWVTNSMEIVEDLGRHRIYRLERKLTDSELEAKRALDRI